MGKRDISKGIPITDPRVLPILLEAVERFQEELKKCKYNPSYLYTKSYFRTTK